VVADELCGKRAIASFDRTKDPRMLRSKTGENRASICQVADRATEMAADLLADSEHHYLDGSVPGCLNEGEVKSDVSCVESLDAIVVEGFHVA
jgi:hypothetical protein